MAEPVKITFLGGLGEIGRNCFCIEVDGRILLVDCGLMFPDADMPGIDLVLPDFTYLREQRRPHRGRASLTHGHEDHVGGLAFLLRDLSFPIYGSALTLGLARNRIEEAGLLDRTELIPVADGERRRIGPFDVRVHPGHPLGAARLRDRVPHARRARSCTPATSSSTSRRSTAASPTSRASARSPSATSGIRLLLSDSTNAERARATRRRSRRSARRCATLFREHDDQRIIIASFASHLHRVQQIADAAIALRPHRRHARACR